MVDGIQTNPMLVKQDAPGTVLSDPSHAKDPHAVTAQPTIKLEDEQSVGENNNPHSLPVSKRPLDSPSSELSNKKRRVDSPSPDLLQGRHQSELEPRCRRCSALCWLCQVPDDPPRVPSQESYTDPYTMPTGVARSKIRVNEAGLIYLGPRHSSFFKKVLEPCNVTRLDGFGVKEPALVFNCTEQPSTSKVFIDLGDEQVEQLAFDFSKYSRLGLDERNLSSVLRDTLIFRDRPVSVNDGVFRVTHRFECQSIKKGGPPVMGESHFYDWDIVPDMIYAVGVNMFKKEIRTKFLAFHDTQVVNSVGVCPYLTLEFKSAHKGGLLEHARNQIAAASTLWVYLRKMIRHQVGSKEVGDIKHYGIIIWSEICEIWETSCQTDGYTFRPIAKCIGLETPEGIRKYVEWSNAIHSWGLGPNASSFQKDIEQLLQLDDKEKGLPTKFESSRPASPHMPCDS